MNIEQCKRAVECVRRIATTGICDNELAHKVADHVQRNVLRSIAQGEPNAAELAREALKTEEIKFTRWYA